MNRIDEKGNVVSGYQDVVETETAEIATQDYLYFLVSSEGIENPKCECVEVDWGKEEKPAIYHACNCGSGEERMTCSAPYGWEFCG